jgi:hypothetical protein
VNARGENALFAVEIQAFCGKCGNAIQTAQWLMQNGLAAMGHMLGCRLKRCGKCSFVRSARVSAQSEGAIFLAEDRPFYPNLSKIRLGFPITFTSHSGLTGACEFDPAVPATFDVPFDVRVC